MSTSQRPPKTQELRAVQRAQQGPRRRVLRRATCSTNDLGSGTARTPNARRLTVVTYRGRNTPRSSGKLLTLQSGRCAGWPFFMRLDCAAPACGCDDDRPWAHQLLGAAPAKNVAWVERPVPSCITWCLASGAAVRGLFGGRSVDFAFKQLSACPPECEAGLVGSNRFEVVANDVVVICETLNFQLCNCRWIG
jgi:hypothetical protein